MSFWSRIGNVFHGSRLSRDIDEEFESHIEAAIAEGRDPAEARQAFGSVLRQREASLDVHMIAWMDSLRADFIFGARQIAKRKLTSAVAILSSALAIGACTSAFRLIDALLLRLLPVASPEQLYALGRQANGFDGKPLTFDGWAYPDFQLMRDAVRGRADLFAISYTERTDVTFRSSQETEKAFPQYISGGLFRSFGLKPALGRLLTGDDDREPGAHPIAVISYDYWTRRFARDPKAVGSTFRMGGTLYEIVGVAADGFTGTEPGTVIDIFVPAMMHPGVLHDDWTWMRTLARVHPGVALEPLRARLNATSHAFEEQRAKGFSGMSQQFIELFLAQTLVMQPAAAGVSELQNQNRLPLAALGVLVLMVLLIACANVANLMTAQAAARSREMALRVSIGAGRGRLVQMVVLESAMLAALASAAGAAFAWWSAPFVVSMINPPDNPARIFLPADWRVLGFGLALTLSVTVLFGLAPALRASAIQPLNALKGGEDPHSRRNSMHVLVGLQAAFCFLILFVAGLFINTFSHLANQATGFSAERLLVLDTIAEPPQTPVYWEQMADRLRATAGVETVALAGQPLLSTKSWNGFVSVNGAPPGPVLAEFMRASPGWIEAMGIHLVEGRDFRRGETTPTPALVNQTFVRQFFAGKSPLGKFFQKGGAGVRFYVTGVIRDTAYRNLRDAAPPLALVPFDLPDSPGTPAAIGEATLIVKTATANPLALAAVLRSETARAGHGFHVSNIRTQFEINASHTVRERLLATLALFFAALALALAGIGLFGVLDYSVLQRRREIAIRIAIGARPGTLARTVTAHVFVQVLVGSLAGLALGMVSVHYIASLLYGVKPTGAAALALPALAILCAAALAAIPPVVRAVRIDPVRVLRDSD